jgi:hypothetical protein
MDEAKDYYELLGIASGAEAGEIKAAFKRMALKYHPDVYPGPDAEERMRLLLEAYKTLIDPNKRRTYDLAHGIRRRGSGGARANDDDEPFGFYRSPGGRGFTAHSGPLPTPKRAGAGESSGQGEAPSPPPRKETEPSSPVTSGKAAVTFPRLDVGTGAVVALGGFVYTLTMQQAARLREDGRLLGADLPQKIAGSEGGGRRCTCHRCGQGWIVPPEQRRTSTERCPKCAAPDWAEYLLFRCQECTAVFESQKIRRYDRVKIGERYYGDYHLSSPYELFPTCPNCQAERWCAGEEMRLTGRTSTAKRPSGPLTQASGPRPGMMGTFPRTRATGTTGAFAPVRPEGAMRVGTPIKMLLTLIIGLLFVGVLFALYAITIATH